MSKLILEGFAYHYLRFAAKPSGSEFVNIGSVEENLLETYFVLLSKFSFDRAKEQCVSKSTY